MPLPAAASAVPSMATPFVVTQVRQALQQTAAIGAFSEYFATICSTRPVAIGFTSERYLGESGLDRRGLSRGLRPLVFAFLTVSILYGIGHGQAS